MLFALIAENATTYLTDTVALAAVALIGYLCGNRTRQQADENADGKLILELARAVHIARELQSVAHRIRQDVALHQSSISQFESRVRKLKSDETSAGWRALSSEAEALLAPTMKLATKLSVSYDQLRKQTMLLMNFAGSRSDPETGVHNRRAMEEQLEVLFSLHQQDDSRFALALFSVESRSADATVGAEFHELLQGFAHILGGCARETDLVARYSTDEFVVLMPQTTIAGATVFGERVRKRVAAGLDCVFSGGIVEVLAEDTPETLLSRADSALYSARASESSCLFQHNGKTIRRHDEEPAVEHLEADCQAVAEEPVLAATAADGGPDGLLE